MTTTMRAVRSTRALMALAANIGAGYEHSEGAAAGPKQYMAILFMGGDGADQCKVDPTS
ncbi:hypothetical protein [Motilimonas eburnea]|uniref:hypothetical protein n=1 Tax=Motilimonas eburnea TaxID=1737488 RepID=UPI001E28B5F7|nr:hypothetical protein [Motilimonas eburnea]MCE2570720.1 hypothetical protein [Motilimonas eburnea]